MNFDLKRPCKSCPFRKDCPPGWLGQDRASELANDVILGDKNFACHKTVYYDNWEDEEYQHNGKEQFCAGAMTLEMKENQGGNFAIRLGRMFKGFKYEDLKDTDLTFNSTDDFIKHHSK